MADEQILTVEIAKLELSPGDILVVKAPREQLAQVIAKHQVMSDLMVPRGVRILYIPSDVELSVLTKSEIDARAAA